MAKSKVLSVRLSGTPVGHLIQTQDGKMRFEYLPETTDAISLSMPIDKKAYGNMPCEKYFGGLLPESENARKAIALTFKGNANSTFSLIREIGHECAGAISIHEANDPIEVDKFHRIIADPISDEDLEQHIIDLPYHPLFIGMQGMRMSLAGVQDKAALCIVNGKLCIPKGSTPTTHILKPMIPKYPLSVQNEYLCLKTAKRIGLPAPEVTIRKAGQQVFLMIERYDRIFDGKETIQRLHQEDFCQALSLREKYQTHGGPGLKESFDLMMRSSLPIVDRSLLMQGVVFNYLIGNADAHGKNFSVLYVSEGVRLAPFYDILCTQFYGNLTEDMCMKIGETYNLGEVQLNDWKTLCEKLNFPFAGLKKIVTNQLSQLVDALTIEREELAATTFEHALLDGIVDQVSKNCAKMTKTFHG